jgi:predicted O-methyltransferase YrrM
MTPNVPLGGARDESARSRSQSRKLVEACLQLLGRSGLLSDMTLDWAPFETALSNFRREMTIDQSAITTRMARLLYALSATKRPRRLLVVGSYQAAALAWLALGAPEAAAIGVDINPAANEVARANLQRAGLFNTVVLQRDGHNVGELLGGPIDLLLLDAEAEVDGRASKLIYSSLISSLEPHLARNALVLAHDACWPTFESDFTVFRRRLLDCGSFHVPMTLPIDRFGLMVTRRGAP